MPYIDWAIAQGFGVIDINVPHYNSQPEVSCNNYPSRHIDTTNTKLGKHQRVVHPTDQ